MSWKRLESTAIDPQVSEGLEARIADPLWLLARQWQTGEFHGDDAPSPVLVEATVRWGTVTKVHTGKPGNGQPILDRTLIETPLETLVERMPVQTAVQDGHLSSAGQISAESGLDLLRTLTAFAVAATTRTAFRNTWKFVVPTDSGLDPRGRVYLDVMARKSMDGRKFYGAWIAAGRDLTKVKGLTTAIKSNVAVKNAVLAWGTAWESFFSEPPPITRPGAPLQNGWDSSRMEHRVQVAAALDGEEVQLDAMSYPGGDLDWYNFDVAPPNNPPLGVDTSVTTREKKLIVLPSPLRYAGMPASRFWELEDGEIYFGDLGGGPEDIARALIGAFATVYSDDWFVVPVRLPAGSVSRVSLLRVLDNHGVKHEILATAVMDGPERVWRFFELEGDTSTSAESPRAPLLFLPPTLGSSEVGGPLEAVQFVRDEVANLAWAIESRVESEAGRVIDRNALWRSRQREAVEIADEAWGYTLTTEVPEHWVPLVPVRKVVASTAPQDPALYLQRGRLATSVNSGTGDAAPQVTTQGALGVILEPWKKLYLHEEEVPRLGMRVVRHFQMARDGKGGVHLWMARKKGPGPGEKRSGLKYDWITREGEK